MKILKNVKLVRYTTFHIGGRADFFTEINNLDNLKKAIDFAGNKNLKIFILGGGSNVLLPDRGIKGLVLKMAIRGVKFKGDKVSVASGEVWDKVVAQTVKRGLGGIENLSLVPGTVGGAVCQNIGAYGAELKDSLESVEVYDTKTGKIYTLLTKDCRFGYRDSIFQHEEGKKLIILVVNLKLSRKYIPNIKYSDLAQYFNKKKPTPLSVRNTVIKIRKSKLVYPTNNIGTAGSFFKNPVITGSAYKSLTANYPDIKGREVGNNLVKIFAGQLIELAGWKGKRIGSVGVSKKHALVLVNYKKGKAEDIKKLSNGIIKSVEEKFKIKLEPEVKIVD